MAFSVAGVIIGGQLGALLSTRISDRLLKTVFALCVTLIAAVYVVTALRNLL